MMQPFGKLRGHIPAMDRLLLLEALKGKLLSFKIEAIIIGFKLLFIKFMKGQSIMSNGQTQLLDSNYFLQEVMAPLLSYSSKRMLGISKVLQLTNARSTALLCGI